MRNLQRPDYNKIIHKHARTLNGLNQRLEAAFLLLGICPQCGLLIVKKRRRRKNVEFFERICKDHGTVSTRTEQDLWDSLEPELGYMTK